MCVVNVFPAAGLAGSRESVFGWGWGCEYWA